MTSSNGYHTEDNEAIPDPIVELDHSVSDSDVRAPFWLVLLLDCKELHLFPKMHFKNEDAEAMFIAITEDEYGPAIFFHVRQGDVRHVYRDLEDRDIDLGDEQRLVRVH